MLFYDGNDSFKNNKILQNLKNQIMTTNLWVEQVQFIYSIIIQRLSTPATFVYYVNFMVCVN